MMVIRLFGNSVIRYQKVQITKSTNNQINNTYNYITTHNNDRRFTTRITMGRRRKRENS